MVPLGSIVTAGRVLELEAKGEGISGGGGGGDELSRTPTAAAPPVPPPPPTATVPIASSVEEGLEGDEEEDSWYLGRVGPVACGMACAWRPSHSVLNAEIILSTMIPSQMIHNNDWLYFKK
jgi:hypothetical protein